MSVPVIEEVLLPTAYLPSIGYFQLLCHAQHAIVERWETYPKQTLRNRTVIMTANGLLTLSIPVVRPNGNHTLTQDIEISYSEPWNIRHWRAILSAYNASPFFLYYRDPLEDLLMQRQERLIDFNNALLHLAIKWLKLDCDLHFSDQFTPAGAHSADYRYNTAAIPSPQKSYYQVFCAKTPFQPNLSILDLLFNLGPDAKEYLLEEHNTNIME